MFATYALASRRFLWARMALVCGLLQLPSLVIAQGFEFPDTFNSPGAFGGKRDAEVTVSAEFTPAQGKRPALVFVTAKIANGFHVYALDQGALPDNGGGPMPTTITLDSNDQLKSIGTWQAVTPPDTHVDNEIWTGLELREHSNSVTWFIPVDLAHGVSPASVTVTGKISGQACNPQTCVPFESTFTAKEGTGIALPETATFAAAPATSPSVPIQTQAAPVTGAPATTLPFTSLAPVEPAVPTDPVVVQSAPSQSFMYLLGLAFLGGLILNVMPCVLPVIGLKVFAFIEQAGQSRWKIFVLNLWYSLGVISVFLILAVLSITFQLGWGQLFQYAEFNIAMASVVFAMGLSFLGVWEIPIPGFIGTSKVTDFGRKEGYEGAFAKGTITTLLATPCTGPFMGSALVGVMNRPPYQIVSVFFAIGLGMASPYLLIGAFPQLVRFLPKPGEWMNTFKQFMGFVLIGTVVYLLTLLKPHFVVPTVAFLFGIWMVCWWIGRVPLTAPANRRWNALGEGIVMGTVIGLVSFFWLSPILEERLTRDANRLADARFEELMATGTGVYTVRNEAWQPYSAKKLEWLLAQGKTVVIDFTADWCPTCKLMEKTVLKTDAMSEYFEDNEVYTLVADWTHQDSSPEVTEKLKELGAQQIPLLAIYSPQNPSEPIVIPGTYTVGGLTAELDRARDTERGVAKAAPSAGAMNSSAGGLR